MHGIQGINRFITDSAQGGSSNRRVAEQGAKQTGYKAVELVNAGIKPRDIMTKEAFYNTIAADMALGGSTNSALHIPAIDLQGLPILFF